MFTAHGSSWQMGHGSLPAAPHSGGLVLLVGVCGGRPMYHNIHRRRCGWPLWNKSVVGRSPRWCGWGVGRWSCQSAARTSTALPSGEGWGGRVGGRRGAGWHTAILVHLADPGHLHAAPSSALVTTRLWYPTINHHLLTHQSPCVRAIRPLV